MTTGEDLWRLVLQVVPRCFQCRQPFHKEDVRLVGQVGDTWVFFLHCPSCHTAALMGLATMAHGELSPEEQRRFAQLSPLSSDDLLDLHNFLENFDGDFRQLLSRLEYRGGERRPQ